MSQMNRRDVLSLAALTGAGLVLGSAGRVFGADEAKKKILFFTKSAGFQHDTVKRKGDELSFGEKQLTELGTANGYEVVCSKDGAMFEPDKIGQWDAFVFYTTEDLTKAGTDKSPPMSKEGKAAFLKAIEGGKGFMGFHCASDTFHSPGTKVFAPLKEGEKAEDKHDPYIAMIGGEFVTHQSQQKAKQKFVSPKFPGLEDFKDFEMTEEWYSLGNLSADMQVILVQDTDSMKEKNESAYRRASYPSTWAKMSGKGRVFYTSMGHRDDVWKSEPFKKVTLAGLAWVTGRTQFEVVPNTKEVTPDVVFLPAK